MKCKRRSSLPYKCKESTTGFGLCQKRLSYVMYNCTKKNKNVVIGDFKGKCRKR